MFSAACLLPQTALSPVLVTASASSPSPCFYSCCSTVQTQCILQTAARILSQHELPFYSSTKLTNDLTSTADIKVPFLDELDSLSHIHLCEPFLTQLPSLPALLPPHHLLQLRKGAEPVPSRAFHAQVAFSCSWISVAPTLVPTIQWLSPLFLNLPHCLAEPSLQSQTPAYPLYVCVF